MKIHFRLSRKNFPPLFTAEVRRRDLDQGDFGAIAPLMCDYCMGVWGELGEVCTFRGNYWEPPEYSTVCPKCGRRDYCAENEDYNGFKVINRYRIKL